MSKKTRERVPPKIFLHIARTGESNKWEMSKELGVAYSNIHRIIKKLLKKKYIYVTKTEKAARNPWINVEYYDLTFLGFITCLLDKRTWKYIDEIAKRRADELPLIFGKWKFFDDQGIKNEILERLPGALFNISKSWEDLVRISEWKTEPPEDYSDVEKLFRLLNYSKSEILEQIQTLQDSHRTVSKPIFDPEGELIKTVVFGLPEWGISASEQENFLSKIKKDSELYEYIRTALYDLKEENEFFLKNICSWIKWWE